jgi:hypothetical protein
MEEEGLMEVGELELFAGKQQLLLRVTDAGVIETARTMLGDGVRWPDDFANVVDIVLSVAGTRVGAADILADLVLSISRDLCELLRDGLTDNTALITRVGRILDEMDWTVSFAPSGSALWGFRPALLRAGRLKALARPEGGGDAKIRQIAAEAAANDVPALGRSLEGGDAQDIRVTRADLPSSVLRRVKACNLLCVAVGAGALDAAKYLMTYHGFRASRPALKMALSTGKAELIHLIWNMLPAETLAHRADLLRCSADFHRDWQIVWLIREATSIEREAFAELTLRRRLADALLIALRNGVRPWSWRSRQVAASWPAASGVAFRSAPTTSPNAGWAVATSGEVIRLTEPPGKRNGDGILELVIPGEPDAIEEGQCECWRSLTHVAIPPSVTTIQRQAFRGCPALVQVTLREPVKKIDACAFLGCPNLLRAEMPDTLTDIAECAFHGCGLREFVVPPKVRVIPFAVCFGCCNLTRVEIPRSVQEILASAFEGCLSLRSVVIPIGHLRRLGIRAFNGCRRLVSLVIPDAVSKVGEAAFGACPKLGAKFRRMVERRFGRDALEDPRASR